MKTKIRCHLPHCSVQKNSVCPNASSCRSFIQIPPIRGLVKAAVAIGPGGRVVKNKACQKSEEYKNPQAPGQEQKVDFRSFSSWKLYRKYISYEKVKMQLF